MREEEARAAAERQARAEAKMRAAAAEEEGAGLVCEGICHHSDRGALCCRKKLVDAFWGLTSFFFPWRMTVI